MPPLDYEPFNPGVQRLGRRHTTMKAAILLTVVFGGFWIFEGRSLYRRLVLGVAGAPRRERSGRAFLAVSFPRISKDGQRFTMSPEDFEATLLGLRRLGYLSIGVRDVEDYYLRDRPLPPKAVLIALERDNNETVYLADAALKKARMRAVLFLNKTIPPDLKGPFRLALSPHALAQLRKSGAWDFGWTSEQPPQWLAGDPVRPPVFDLGEETHAWTRNPYRFPMRFIASRTGFNDGGRLMSALRILRVRTDRPPEDNLRAIASFWPRREAFADEFRVDGLGLDWVSERGVVVAVGRRLVLVPTPKQKTASAFLSGTDHWRDCVVEFQLSKYRKNAWLYARSAEGRWVRVGARDGYWYLQQKVGAGKKPVTLARAPMTIVTGLPARVRLVLKGPWALVQVNGRMQYGKAVRVHSGIDEGRVELDIYDPKPAASLAVVTGFHAAPLGSRWLSVNPEAVASLVGERQLVDGVRERAMTARVLSPRWFDVLADGRVAATDADRELVRNLAGYYRCELVPLVDFAAPEARLPKDKQGMDRMLEELLASLQGTEAVGLNVRLSARRVNREQASFFLRRLRERLHDQRRRLWVTLEAGAQPDAAWVDEVDGVLRAVEQPAPGASVLEMMENKPAAAPRGGAA